MLCRERLGLVAMPSGPASSRTTWPPRHVLQLWRKQLPISETFLIKDAAEVHTRLSWFRQVTLSHPRVKPGHEFPTLVV